MKDWRDLTVEEFANLTEEQVEQYKKLICAQEGIKMLEKPIEPKKYDDSKEDCEVYKLNGISGLYFADFQEALQTVDFLRKMKTLGNTRYAYNTVIFEAGTTRDYTGEPVDISISTEMCYSKQKAAELEGKITAYKKAREEYDAALKDYYNAQKEREEATSYFAECYEKAVGIMLTRKRLSNLFYNEYLPLADNNIEMAMGFLKKAYTVSEADEQYILAQKTA